MKRFSLHAAQCVLPGRVARDGYLVVQDGLIEGFYQERPDDCEVVELGDAWLGPGLVDTHIHGFFGHATTDADAEGLLRASIGLARQGTTSWIPTTFTDSVEHITEQCQAIARAAQLTAREARAARIQGIYLEGPFFTEKHKGAQNPAYLLPPSYELFRHWQDAAQGMICKSALAPEYEEAPAYCAQLAAENVVCALGHSDASYEQAMACVEAGATVFVHAYNGMRGLHHREPGLLGCAFVSKGTTAELICDGRHVSPAACEVLVRCKGWEHVALITDCLGCGGLPDGPYESGGLPVVLKDGVCWLADMSALAGSTLTLAEGVRNMATWGIVTPEQAIRMATEVPARSAHIDGSCGLLLPDRRADLTVFDRDLSLQASYLAGHLVS